MLCVMGGEIFGLEGLAQLRFRLQANNKMVRKYVKDNLQEMVVVDGGEEYTRQL